MPVNTVHTGILSELSGAFASGIIFYAALSVRPRDVRFGLMSPKNLLLQNFFMSYDKGPIRFLNFALYT